MLESLKLFDFKGWRMQIRMALLKVFVGVILAFTSGFGMQGEDISYKIYDFEEGKLYLAQNAQGILFAGVKNEKFQGCEISPNKVLKNGELKCGEKVFVIKNGEIQNKIALQDSFNLKSQEVVYRYSKDSLSQVSTLVLCSSDLEVQNLLELMYEKDFNCANVKETFLPSLEVSMQEYLKNIGGMEALAYLKKFPLEEMVKDRLYYFDDEILVLERTSYLYTGGAHGNHGKWGVIISRKEGIVPLNEMIDLNNLELKKLLWIEYQKYLTEIDNVAQDYVDFENFKVSDAILIDYDGVVFIYQPYEVMPYAYGIVELKLPLESIEKFGNFSHSALGYLFAK